MRHTVDKIKSGPYTGKYLYRSHIIFNEAEARVRFPDQFKTPAKKKAGKNRSK